MWLRVVASAGATGILLEKMAILVVEDEILVSFELEDALEGAGFRVDLARNGQEAIDRLENDGGRFSAVVTDIRLGQGPSGWKVADRARELRPDIPVIYITGDSGHEWEAKGVRDSAFLQKPFMHDELVFAVASLLNDQSPT